MTVLLQRTIRGHLLRARPEKILDVLERIHLRFFQACGLASDCTAFASFEGHVRQAPSPVCHYRRASEACLPYGGKHDGKEWLDKI